MTAEAQRVQHPMAGVQAEAGPSPAAPDGSQRVGVFLRETRQSRNLSLDDVSTVLRIRESHVGAIEDGRFRDLPGPTYAVGFVRSYARYLGLDEAAVVQAFKDEVAAVEAEADLVLPYATRERRFPSAALLVASVLIAAGVYGGWHVFSAGEQRGGATTSAAPADPTPANDTAAVPDPAAAAPDGEALPPADQTQPAAGPTEPAPATDDRSSALPDANGVAAAQTAPSLLRASQPAGDVQVSASGAPDLASTLAVSASAPGAATARPRIAVQAISDGWIQVSSPSGAALYSRILSKGESFVLPDIPGLLLTVGNTGTVQLVVNGRVLPPLGPAGTVRRDIPLDSEILAARH